MWGTQSCPSRLTGYVRLSRIAPQKNYEGRVSLSRVNRNEWQSTFRNGRNAAPMAVSKSQRHHEMARLNSQSRVESLRVDAGGIVEQFDQLAAPGAGVRARPLPHALS